MTERSNKKKYPLCAAALALAVLLAGCAPAEGAAAATAQPTAEPTEAPTPTPEPEANPLTGEQGDYTNQRPVAVSIRTGDGSTPQWGIAAADVLIEGVTEGKTAGLTAVFASVDSVEKAGPVAPGRDLPLQLVLPLNAVPVHINKSVYASNLLNVLQYQDLDGYHAGTAGFAFDEDRANSGYREENCWYTTTPAWQPITLIPPVPTCRCSTLSSARIRSSRMPKACISPFPTRIPKNWFIRRKWACT